MSSTDLHKHIWIHISLCTYYLSHSVFIHVGCTGALPNHVVGPWLLYLHISVSIHSSSLLAMYHRFCCSKSKSLAFKKLVGNQWRIRSDIDVLDIIYTVYSTWMSVCDWRQEGNRGPMWQDLKDVWSSLNGGNQSGCTSIFKEFLVDFSDGCSQMLSEIDIFNFSDLEYIIMDGSWDGLVFDMYSGSEMYLTAFVTAINSWNRWHLRLKTGVAAFRPAKHARAGAGSLIKFLIIWSPVLIVLWVCSWPAAGNLFGFGC